MSKICFEEKHVDLLVRRGEGKKHYDFIKDYITFMYDRLCMLSLKKTFLLLLFTSP